eukprot:UN10135
MDENVEKDYIKKYLLAISAGIKQHQIRMCDSIGTIIFDFAFHVCVGNSHIESTCTALLINNVETLYSLPWLPNLTSIKIIT